MRNLPCLILALLALSQPALASDTIEALKTRLSGRSVGVHQGGIFGFKPNTIRAFEKSRRRGADIVEMDLRISKDNVPVVFHDARLNTWTKCRGPVRDKTVAELKQCRFKLNHESIPTFEEVLTWSQGRIIINAEFKDPETISPVISLIQKYQAHAWTYFQARDWNKYQTARALDPDLALQADPRDPESLKEYLALNDPAILVIEVDQGTNTPEMLDLIHQAGKLSSENSWHFSKGRTQELFGASCATLFARGIDIAITNRPVSCLRQRE